MRRALFCLGFIFALLHFNGISKGVLNGASASSGNNLKDSTYIKSLRNTIYNGAEYYGPTFKSKLNGTPSYKNLLFVDSGKLCVNGVWFDQIPLMYDLIGDELITRHQEKLVNVKIIQENIESFCLGIDTFDYVRPFIEDLSPGIYKRVYISNDYKIYSKYSKQSREVVSGSSRETRLDQNVEYFVFKVNDQKSILRIRNEADIIKLDSKISSHVQNYLKSSSLKFKDDPEKVLTEALSFIENFTTQ